MVLPIFQADAFTDVSFAGNPAAVVVLPNSQVSDINRKGLTWARCPEAPGVWMRQSATALSVWLRTAEGPDHCHRGFSIG